VSAEEAGLRPTRLAMAFAIAHPGVTSAIIGPRTMEQLDDLLAGVGVTLTDEILDRIDEIVPPGTDVGTPDQSAYLPPALQCPQAAAAPSTNAPPPDRCNRIASGARGVRSVSRRWGLFLRTFWG
jgi:Aldo/keto reductase family